MMSVVSCGSIDGRSETCAYVTSAAVSEAGTITLAVASPSGVTIAAAVASDSGGGFCPLAAGAGTPTITLTCSTGLEAGASVAVTFAPIQPGRGIRAAAAYNVGSAGSTSQQIVFAYPPNPPSGFDGTVTYAAGWNLVGGPAGWNLYGGPRATTVPAAGPLYTYQAADIVYEMIPDGVPPPTGVGVWAYFASPTTVTLPPLGVATLAVPLPPSHWVMIANPGYRAATVAGADAVEVYDPTTGAYEQAATLQPGEGAWAYSAAGATITITSASR
jgi:hypothetical protein